ncbi:MAG: amidohydrolase family protein [Desulforhopalus sp.]
MAEMIIDSHTHIINQREPVWGWGPHFNFQSLIAMMDRGYDVMGETKNVEKAIVMTGLGLTSVEHRTIMEAHQYALLAIEKHKERLYMAPVLNPRAWGADDLEILNDWQENHNLCMLKLHPSMHNYYLPSYNPYPNEASKKLIYPIFEKARELNVPIMMHQGETPYAMPCQVAPIAEAFPDVPVVVAHSGANNIPAMANDAILLARTHDNIFLGTSWVQAPELNQMYHAIGADKIIFESDCSPVSQGHALRFVTNLHLAPPLGCGATREEVYKMIGGNIAGLCGIPTE